MVRQLSCKKDSVSDMQTLKLFVNTLSADDKYSFVNRNNLTELIEMQLSEKRKTFSEFISTFLKSSLNFAHFEKKDDLIADVFLRLLTPKNVVRSMCKKFRFRLPFEKQHGKPVPTLLKSQGQHLYHIDQSM